MATESTEEHGKNLWIKGGLSKYLSAIPLHTGQKRMVH